MKLRFVKMNPTGNTTVFVLDPVPVPDQAKTALALMAPSVLGGEQVGFVSLAPTEGPPGAGPACGGPGPTIAASLRMMGGEFCGNAARSLGAYLAYKHAPGLSWDDHAARGFIRVSGATAPLAFEAQLDRDAMPCWAGCRFPGPFRVIFHRVRGQTLDHGLSCEPYANAAGLPPTWLGMTLGAGEGAEATAEADDVSEVAAAAGAPKPDAPCGGPSTVAVVHLPGITHVVVDAHEYTPAEAVLYRLRSALGLEAEPGMGVMFCSGHGQGRTRESHDGPGEVVVPLVHVQDTDTTLWESSCASGAVAVALANSIATGRPGRFASRQPGGILYTAIDAEDERESCQGVAVYLEGEVRIVAEGEVIL